MWFYLEFNQLAFETVFKIIYFRACTLSTWGKKHPCLVSKPTGIMNLKLQTMTMCVMMVYILNDM